MSVSTSTPLGPDFPKQMVDLFFKAVEDGTLKAYRMLWDALLTFLSAHVIAVMLVMFIALIFTFLKAMMGRWGSLGSLLYNIFYFGILFIIGLIWGPEVFANDVFNAACAVILYPLCYIAVGMILDRMDVRRFK
jgi:hypothetical protein